MSQRLNIKAIKISNDTADMEAEIISMYYTNDSTEHYNSSEIITQLTSGKSSVKWTNEEIGRFIHIIVRPISFHIRQCWKLFNNLYYETNLFERCVKLFLYVFVGSSRFT